jgi:YD repeat-containing protein
VGHPINPASGAVYDILVDAGAASHTIDFKRFYDSTSAGGADLSAGWRHSYTRGLTPIYSSSSYQPYVPSVYNSSQYSDEATACTSGFAEIKARVSSWATANASYVNGLCAISLGTSTIARLPILYGSPPTPAPGTTSLIGIDALRDDGQLISFTVNGSAIVAPPSIGMTLQQTANGYTLTDQDDRVEQYDSKGRLLSITTRAGIVQTMGYDTSNRLSTVTDSFGHSLSLTYDGQNRLSSVTRQ